MKLKEIKWKIVPYYQNSRSSLLEGKIGWRVVGKIYPRGRKYDWVAQLGSNNEIGSGTSLSAAGAKSDVAQALEVGIIKKFFQKEIP